jgi:sulfite exporter TauE/SafE
MLWTFHISFLSAISGALAALVTAAGAGVAAGALHSLSGPDHIAGLAAHAINQPPSTAVGLGTIWASGHVAGQCGVGAALVLMRAMGAPMIKQVLFEKWSTIGVAVTLMIIGLAGLLEARMGADEADEEEVGPDPLQTEEAPRTATMQKLKRTFVTGFVHGLSPDGLFMLFPLLTMSASSGMMHLIGIFGGTCLSMSACTAGLCYGARRLARSSSQTGVPMGRMQTMISLASSLIALGFGVIMMYTGVFRAF